MWQERLVLSRKSTQQEKLLISSSLRRGMKPISLSHSLFSQGGKTLTFTTAYIPSWQNSGHPFFMPLHLVCSDDCGHAGSSLSCPGVSPYISCVWSHLSHLVRKGLMPSKGDLLISLWFSSSCFSEVVHDLSVGPQYGQPGDLDLFENTDYVGTTKKELSLGLKLKPHAPNYILRSLNFAGYLFS